MFVSAVKTSSEPVAFSPVCLPLRIKLVAALVSLSARREAAPRPETRHVSSTSAAPGNLQGKDRQLGVLAPRALVRRRTVSV